MPCFCPQCRARVPEDGNSISCDYCRKWYHLECTDLTKTQFDIFSKDKSFEWVCNKCVSNVCSKCSILTRNNTKIQCEKCMKSYHLRCAGLSRTAYIPTTCWYCYQCQLEIFPFNNLSVSQITNVSFNSLNLISHPNQLRSLISSQNVTQEPDYCRKCNNNNITLMNGEINTPIPTLRAQGFKCHYCE